MPWAVISLHLCFAQPRTRVSIKFEAETDMHLTDLPPDCTLLRETMIIQVQLSINGPVEDTNRLCQRCRCLDFEQMFSGTRVPERGLEIVDLGKRNTSKRKAITCNLCRWFSQLGPDYTKNFTQHVRLFTGIKEAQSYDSVPQLPSLCTIRKNARLSYDAMIESEFQSAGIVYYTPYEGSSAFQLGSVDAASANWEMIGHGLEHCSQ